MEVKLAGYNVDVDNITELKKCVDGISDCFNPDSEDRTISLINIARLNYKMGRILKSMTPETIAASYARISRDPRPIPEIRKSARNDVEKARKTNTKIIFGAGHKSIAEHGVFNLDVMGISRKAVELLEEKRLCSYTEKSQRYITLNGDYVIPDEIKYDETVPGMSVVPAEISNAGFEKKFRHVIENIQNKFYFDNLSALTAWHSRQDYSKSFRDMHIENEIDKAKKIEEFGKEDARYSLAMATQAQLGETISGRNLEVLITKARSSQVAEERELGEKLFEAVKGIAPSLVKYTDATEYFSKTRPLIRKVVADITAKQNSSSGPVSTCRVSSFPGYDRDTSIIAGLVFSSSNISYQDSLRLVRQMDKMQKTDIRDASIAYKKVHDPMLREYELREWVVEFVISSSAFAQLKRHRMNTLIPQDYNIELGVTVPPSVKGIGKDEEFLDVMRASEALYLELKSNPKTASVADYILTNAHRRRVLFDANNRQVYAFAAERQNVFAQWDIGKTAQLYAEAMKQQCPLTLEAVCGKHEHDLTIGAILSE
jgi:thymidylate synthase ThyX